MYNLSEIWLEVIEIIRADIPEVSFNTWIENIVPVSYEEGVLTLEVPLLINKNMVEKRFLENIRNAFEYFSFNLSDVNILIAAERK